MLIAHRGYYDKYVPENSMTAFRRCIEKNIPIELDIHLTKDKKVVVFHDYNLFRMTGLSKKIENMTYEEIEKLSLKGTNEKIPLFEDVLKVVNNKVFLMVELKNKKIGPLEDEVLKITKNYSNLSFQTFKLKSVYYLKKRTNKKVGLLVMNHLSKALARSKKIDFISQNLFSIDKYKIKKDLFVFNINNKTELSLAKIYATNFIVDISKVLA